MFTDEPVTPARIEVLIDLLRSLPTAIERSTAVALLQPEALPGVTPNSKQGTLAVSAAIQLNLINDGTSLRLTFERSDPRTTRDLVLDAFDRRVMGSDEVEPYFARFYSFLLQMGSSDAAHEKKIWANQFNQQFYGGLAPEMPNPFNGEKITGMHRWLHYAGLGWYDPKKAFQCNPYDRIRRALPKLFGKARRLADEDFIAALAGQCPEMDGGRFFDEVAQKSQYASGHRLSAGLSHALVELHLDNELKLECSSDSGGWSLSEAEPPAILAERLDYVEWTHAA
jgi:hypothetical protein